MPTKGSRPTYRSLGIPRAPSAYALFCQHVKKFGKQLPLRRRVLGKSLVNEKTSVRLRWSRMSPGSRETFVGGAQQRVAANRQKRFDAVGQALAPCLRPGEMIQSEGVDAPPLPLATEHDEHNCPGASSVQDPIQDVQPQFTTDAGVTVRCLKKLGSGGYGNVFQAIAVQTGAEYAVKYGLRKRHVPNLIHEADALKLLGSHPHIIPYYGMVLQSESGTIGTLLGLAQTCLAQCLFVKSEWEQEISALPVKTQVALQITLAVSHLHQKGVVHCDLKPANVLVTKKEHGLHVWVADFGLSAILSKGAKSTGDMIGTKPYRPVECLLVGEDEVTVTPRMDIWSLGCMCFDIFQEVSQQGRQLLFPRPLVEARTAFARALKLYSKYLDEHFRKIPDEGIKKVVRRCLTADRCRIDAEALVRLWLAK